MPTSICPLCNVTVGAGHLYNVHIGSFKHAKGYLREMSKHGPAYFYQMYGNLPFPDSSSLYKDHENIAGGIQPRVQQKLPKEQATDFTPINNPHLIPKVLHSLYEVTLVCSKCFPRENEGYGHFIMKAALIHQCERDVLVVRQKGEKSWSKIRSQRPWVAHRGQYKLCQQFWDGVPCKVPENCCSFCHNNEEIHMWGLEQEKLLDIQKFCTQLKNYVDDPWSPEKETNPFMVYAMRCGMLYAYKCKGCVKQLGDLKAYRAHILDEEHQEKTNSRISEIGEEKYREVHFDVPSWPQEILFQSRTSFVFPETADKLRSNGRGNDEKKNARALSAKVVPAKRKLTNPSDKKVSFKVKTTAPKQCHVRPNNALIKKVESATAAGKPQENERIPKRGASPEHLSDKRACGDNRGFNQRDSKMPDIAVQLQQMLKQLVNAQGFKPLLPASSSQQPPLEEFVEKTPQSPVTAGHRSRHGMHQHTGGSGSSSDPSMNKPAATDASPELCEKNLYFAGLPDVFNHGKLRAMCSPFGEVIYANVKGQKNQQMKYKQGFVEMRARHECLRIIEALDGHTVQGGSQPLIVRFAYLKKLDKKREHKSESVSEQQNRQHTMSLEDKLLEEAKRKEEELRRRVKRKEEELKEEARLDGEQKQAELRRKEEELRRRVEQKGELKKVARLDSERKQSRWGSVSEQQTRHHTMSLEDKLLQAAKRKEEELRRRLKQKEEELKKEARLDSERKQAELRQKMEKIEAEREKFAREREQEKVRLEQEQKMEKIWTREKIARDREQERLRLKQKHLDEIRGAERGVSDLNEDRSRESSFGQHGSVREQMTGERKVFSRDQDLRQAQIPETVALPMQQPSNMTVDNIPLQMRQHVLQVLDQLKMAGVANIEMVHELMDVIGDLNPPTMNVLGEINPATLEQFAVLDPEMLMQLAKSMPQLGNLLEMVNLPALTTLVRAIGPRTVQLVSRLFAHNPELFLAMRTIIEAAPNIQRAEKSQASMGDDLPLLPQDPSEGVVGHRLHQPSEGVADHRLHQPSEGVPGHRIHQPSEGVPGHRLHQPSEGVADLHQPSEGVPGHRLHQPSEGVAGHRLHQPSEGVPAHRLHQPSEGVPGHCLHQPSEAVAGHRLHQPSEGVAGHRLHQPSEGVAGHRPHQPSEGVAGHRLYQPSEGVPGHRPHQPSEGVGGHRLHQPSEGVGGHRLHQPSEGVVGHRLYQTSEGVVGHRLHQLPGAVADHRLHFLQEQIKHNTTPVAWPPKPRTN